MVIKVLCATDPQAEEAVVADAEKKGPLHQSPVLSVKLHKQLNLHENLMQ